MPQDLNLCHCYNKEILSQGNSVIIIYSRVCVMSSFSGYSPCYCSMQAGATLSFEPKVNGCTTVKLIELVWSLKLSNS
jgi:hypothetical protein